MFMLPAHGKCLVTCGDVRTAVYAGLIVGAVIKYTSSLPKRIMKESVVVLNSSAEWTGPPDYVRLRVPYDYNDTHTEKYYHYSFDSLVAHQEPVEPELEEKVH